MSPIWRLLWLPADMACRVLDLLWPLDYPELHRED